MFRNLSIYRITENYSTHSQILQSSLEPQAFQPCTSLDMKSVGWVSPRSNGNLSHTFDGKNFILTFGEETKLLPAKVINQVTKMKAAEIEGQQGFKPGRKQMKEIKEDVTDELLPRAFSVFKTVNVWIDSANGFLVIDSASPSKCDDVLKLLFKSFEKFPLQSLHLASTPVSAMSNWLSSDEAPNGFTVDQDTELRSSGAGRATVKYAHHTLEAEDVQRHIAGGKQCTKLALTWADKISFVLTESFVIKRIAPLDVIKENADTTAKNDDERYDSDMALMCGELSRMIPDLIEAVGGEVQSK